MKISTIENEFDELTILAHYIIENGQAKDLTLQQLLELCMDMRQAEREPEPDIRGKNIVIPEKTVLQ